jgi:DNA ligase (NAD+)
MRARFFSVILCVVVAWAASLAMRAAEAAQVGAVAATRAARVEIAELRSEIARHDALYHRQAAPEISDADYDALKRKLRVLEATFPDIAREVPAVAEVGDDRSGLFKTYRHRERMMSLEKAYTEAELRAFAARVAKAAGRKDIAWVVEPKFDGLAVSVTFEGGAASCGR